MKAIIYRKYGPPEVLHQEEIAKPVPKDDEILVKVHAATVTAGDAVMRSGNFPPLFWLPARLFLGLTKPKKQIPGMEFAGRVEAVGKDVTRFKPGDDVFGSPGGFNKGSSAEYLCRSQEGSTTLKPANIDYGEAAAIPVGGLTALFFLRKAGIRSGQKVLIYGASGSVGTYAVQLAKHFGAEVTGICSTANVDLVKSLGADRVIDYTKEDFSKSGEKYDIIFDTVGKSPLLRSVKSLKKKGAYPMASSEAKHLFGKLWLSLTSGKKVIGGITKAKAEDLAFLTELIEAGKLKVVIDRRFPFEQIVEAHRLVDSKRKRGNVVITLGSQE